MRVKLIDLLADRSIVHPSQIEAIEWSADELRFVVRGHRWWRPPYSGQATEGVIHLMFRELTDGTICPDEFNFDDDEALENLDITSIADVGWAQPSDCSIFCSAPIPDPLRLYVLVHDFLSAQGSFRTPAAYLNQARQLASFVAMTSSPGFLVASGPECIRTLVCDELQSQGVAFDVVQIPADTSAGYLVSLGDSAFPCREAEAELDPP